MDCMNRKWCGNSATTKVTTVHRRDGNFCTEGAVCNDCFAKVVRVIDSPGPTFCFTHAREVKMKSEALV